jgi:p21-activated kinase 1
MHVGSKSSTGEFPGMPKEWKQLLQESGITRLEQEKNPRAPMEVGKFYQEGIMDGNDAVWENMSHVTTTPTSPTQPTSPAQPLSSGQRNRDREEGMNMADAGTSSSNFAGANSGGSYGPGGALQTTRPGPAPPTSPSIADQARSPTSQQQQQGHMPAPSTSQSVPPSFLRSASSRGPHKAPPNPRRGSYLPPSAASPRPQPGTGTIAPQPDRQRPAPPPPSAATTALNKAAQQAAPQGGIAASPSSVPGARRREKKKDPKDSEDIVKRLQAICTDADPTRLYRNLVNIDQDAIGRVCTAHQVGTNLPVAIKQMGLDRQPKKDLIINEILMMRSSRHPNIINYIDSFLYQGDRFLYKKDLWVVMEYMEGGSLTDVLNANFMTEGQISAVSRETAQGD